MPNNNCAWYIVTVFSCLSLYFVRFYFLERRIARIRSNFYSNFLCIYSFLSCLSVSFSLSLRSIAVHCISINYFGIPCEKVQLKICRFFFFFVLPFCLKLWLNRFGPVWFSVINGSWVMWLWHSFFLGSVCCCCCRTATDVALILLLHCFYFFLCFRSSVLGWEFSSLLHIISMCSCLLYEFMGCRNSDSVHCRWFQFISKCYNFLKTTDR